jgi:adenine-specific DNA-methyltransferase
VEKAFEGYAQTERESLQKRIEETKKKILENLGKEAFGEQGQLVKFHETPLGKEYTALLEELAHYQISEDLKIRVYNDLYSFFSRYYEDGDFIAKRRYGRDETYAIPYNGEEVVFHWATKDQYYIKTGERFRNYRFKVQNYTVVFELCNATTEQNNNKGEKRYFILASDNPVVLDPETKTLTVFFEYRPLTDAEQKEHGRTEQQKPQDSLNKKAANDILEQLRDLTSKDLKASEDSKKELEDLKAQLEKPEAANEQSRLMKHLTRFTRRNTSDFFIHKDLRGFLRRELDFFIKSQSLLLDELLAQKENLTHQHIQRARVVRDIGYKIIDFLAQVEDFQKRLFEKKKFVIRTEYCLTIDRVPEDLWDEVLGNGAQLAEWRELCGVDPQPTEEFLRQHPTLVVDTRHFSEDFKWRLLKRFDDLDEALDGVLIKSENFQALNLLLEKYRGKVKCVYIDPPYNTGNDDFIYKDRYQHSSWLSMMADRLELAKQLMADDGSIYVQVDWNEDSRLSQLMNMIFGEQQFRNRIIWYYTNKIPDTRKRLFTNSTDYLLFYAKTELNQFIPLTEPRKVPIKVSKMRKEKGKKVYEKDEQGRGIYIERTERVMDNVWQIPLLHAHPEMVHFHTQKPEEIVRRVFASSTRERELVLDFFLGSGTATSVATKMHRKWIGIEVGDFFETVTLRRMKRVIAGEQTGVSQSVGWQGGGFFKYLYLEQYEDTLNNLELPREQEGQLALERCGDEYLLRYMLDFETQGSPSLLNLEQVQDPFNYKLKVQEGDEIQERVVDLVETFNYLLGIHVKKMRQCRDNGRLYRAVLGEKDGKRIVIVWRPLKGLNGDTGALQRDKEFIQSKVLPTLLGKGKKPDRLLVNGICYVPDAEPIEPEFKRLMMGGAEAQA